MSEKKPHWFPNNAVEYPASAVEVLSTEALMRLRVARTLLLDEGETIPHGDETDGDKLYVAIALLSDVAEIVKCMEKTAWDGIRAAECGAAFENDETNGDDEPDHDRVADYEEDQRICFTGILRYEAP